MLHPPLPSPQPKMSPPRWSQVEIQIFFVAPVEPAGYTLGNRGDRKSYINRSSNCKNHGKIMGNKRQYWKIPYKCRFKWENQWKSSINGGFSSQPRLITGRWFWCGFSIKLRETPQLSHENWVPLIWFNHIFPIKKHCWLYIYIALNG